MNLRSIKLVFYFILIGSSFIAYSQTVQIDSLRNRLIQDHVTLEEKQTIILKLCEQNSSLSADSLLKFVSIGFSLFPEKSHEYLKLKNHYVYYLFKKGKVAEALIYIDSLLRNTPPLTSSERIQLDLLASKGSALVRNNENKEGIEEGLKLLALSEQMMDSASIIKATTIIGWANMEIENYPEAIRWLQKGARVAATHQLQLKATALYNNIASCFNNIDLRDSAFRYITLAMKLEYENENLTNLANSLNIRAAMFIKENKMKEAEHDLEEALHARERIGDIHFIVSDMGQLASFYASNKEPEKGIAVAKKGIELAKSINNLSKLIFLNIGLAENYRIADKKIEYAQTLANIIKLKDSLYEKNSEGAIAEMMTKYELQKKQNIIIQQENKLARNKYFSIGSLIALILASIIIWLIYRNYKHIQQRKMQEALAEEKLHSLQAVQVAEERERKRIAADLHDNLGSYAAAISSNIRYLKQEDTPENHLIISQLDENAQGIVTQLSDTIWILKNERLPITKLADRFKAWAQRIIPNYPNVTYYYTEDILQDIDLTPGTVLNIFLILKECLNNSLKHSNCTEIRIHISSNEFIDLMIEDNGIGLQSNVMNRGNGIDHIKYRAKECGFRVEWKNLQPSGTRVCISNHTTN